MSFDQVATAQSIETAQKALAANGITVLVVSNAAAAKEAVLKRIPKQAEVMTMTSVTLDETGLNTAINESGDFNLVKDQLSKMNRETDNAAMQKLGAAPSYAVGSVHAVTENGEVVIASNTGSQLPAYAYGSEHVIWVVGAQKIVKNLDQAMKRIHEYVLPLESERARQAYGVPGSNVSKLLFINKEVNPERLTMVIVKEKLGY